MNAVANIKLPPVSIERADLFSSILGVTGRESLVILGGTIVTVDGKTHAFDDNTEVELPALTVGEDYGIRIGSDGSPVAEPALSSCLSDGLTFAGFHYAPSGNAVARGGGDGVPAINPCSCWDVGFRPACADPRGMTLVTMAGDRLFWADIYLLGIHHLQDGTSGHNAVIADGRSLPDSPDGSGRARKLDYATAAAIYAHHGKSLIAAEEFFAASHGVTERKSRDGEPERTGEAAGVPFVSRFGLFDATGTMWQWGTDGDPDKPRASIFGGSWWHGGDAGSRCALLGGWPEFSSECFSARGRSDHLTPA